LLGKKVFAYFNRKDLLPFFRFYYGLTYKSLKASIGNLLHRAHICGV
jgi:hypothetical protein